jgi:AraC family transcriptional regulator of adaptative response/methylated-DNA-[protein]-cysteine methyltransferase
MPTPTRITFNTAPSAVGLILTAREEHADALLAVLIGEREDALRAELATRFPGASIVRDTSPLGAQLAAGVVGAIASPAAAGDIAIDPRGTSFQQVVWNALRMIPAGTTTTYSALARRIGRPAAVRAVAGACAANPIAILIPCHRVVRTDGGLSGYRWGVERKRALLEREGALEGALEAPEVNEALSALSA